MEKEVREVRREAEGAGPTSEDPRPPSIGADADSSSASTSLSQHTLSQYTLAPATGTSSWDATFLSQGPLHDSTSRILDLSQYPMADYTSNSEFTLSQHPLQESTVSERLEPLGVEETEADNGLGAVNRWFALQEDTDSPVKRPLNNLAHNLSLGAVELAMMEISREEEKDSVDRHVSEVSNNLIEGTLSLSEHSIKTTPGQDLLMLKGVDSVSNKDSSASLTQHTMKTTPGQDSTGSLSQHSFKTTPGQDSLMLQSLDCTSNKDSMHDSKSSLLEQQTLGEESISQHTLSSSHESGFSTSGTSSEPPRTMQNGVKGVSDSLMSCPLEATVTNKLSSTADQTMQFQPLVQNMTIGDSYLEKRPISSSTPSSGSNSTDVKDYSIMSNSESLYQPQVPPPKANNVVSKGESVFNEPSGQSNSVQESGSISLSGSMSSTDLKEPMALIHKAGVDNYMTPDERASLVPAPPPETIITREEREEIFSDIFRAPPPGELSRSRSGSQRSLAGSEKSSKSDKRSTISEPEVNRLHSKYSTGDRMSLITPGVSHAGDSIKHASRLADQSRESMKSGSSNESGARKVYNDKTPLNLVDQLSITRVTESLESFDCISTTSHQSADRHSNKSNHSLINQSQRLEAPREQPHETTRDTSGNHSSRAEESTSSSNDVNVKEARHLEHERLALGGFERPSTRRSESPSGSVKGRGTPEDMSATRSVGRSSNGSQRSAQAAAPPLTALEQLAITTAPTGSSDQVTSAPASLARRSSGISDGDEATSIWSQSVAGEDRSESEQLSARSLLSQTSARSHHSHHSAASTHGQIVKDGREKVSNSRPSSAHSSQGQASQSAIVDDIPRSETTPVPTIESTPAVSRPESSVGKHRDDGDEDQQSVCSNLTERVASLLSRPTQDGLTLVQVTTGEDSRPLSAASVETLKDNPLEGIESLGVPNVSEGRILESPHSQFSDSSSTSYQDLPSSLNPHVLATKPKVAVIAETSFEEQPLSRCSTAAMSDDTMDPEVKKILKRYGEVMSEEDRCEDVGPFSSSHRATPTGSVAESDDTTLTHRVNRLLHGTSDLDKSYLYEDPARSITLGLASGSTTRTNTPPPTASDLNTFSKSNDSLHKIQKGSSSRTKPHEMSKDVSDHRRPTEEDSLSDRMRHLLGDASTGPGSVSSGRSSRTSSVNYDVLQNDLEEIQLGLAILQNGDLALDHPGNSVGSSRRMSDASEGAVSKVTGSEVGTPRKFSWDYGDLNGEDTANFRFVTSRSDLHSHVDQKKTQRGEPEGFSEKNELGSVRAKTSTSEHLHAKSSESLSSEGKYTRIARELEKETSPQRRAPLSTLASDSGPTSWSGTNSKRYDFIGRSYESLTRSGINAEVEPISTKKKSHSEDSNSFTQKVNDLMERESPQRQAYRYLAEAEDSIRIMEAKRGSRLHASDTELNNTSTLDSSASSSFRMTPIPTRSFQAFGNVQSFLTTQLTKMSSAQFDTSIELRSPIKRHVEKQIVATGTSRGSELSKSSELSRSSEFIRSSDFTRSSEFARSSEFTKSSDFARSSEFSRSSEVPKGSESLRSSDLTRTSDSSQKVDVPRNSELSRDSGFRDSVTDRLRAYDPPSEQNFSERHKALSTSVRPEHAERNKHWDAVRVEMESRISDTMAEYVPMPHPVTMQDYVNGTYRNTLTDRLRERERSKEDLTENIREDHSLKPTETPKTPADRSGLHGAGDSVRDQVGAAASEQVIEDQLTPRSDGSVDSVVGLISAPRSARSDHSAKSDRSARSDRSDRRSSNNLRPYRPPGSSDLYYVESGTDDGNASVANSETTIESTHIGSDDARAPHFPSHWLGSRSDPNTPTGSGLYSQIKPTTLQLDPIVENKSFEEPKPQEVSSSEDKTLIEESFVGKNRSHHNNSDLHEVSDASTGSEDQAPGARGGRSENRRDPSGGNRDMRFMNEDLESGRWEKYNQPEVYAGHQRHDAATRYNDIPIAKSARYWPDLGHYPNDTTPDHRSRHPAVSTQFGTPQRHVKSNDSTPAYTDSYPRRGQDPYSLNNTGCSLQDSYQQYVRSRERGDRDRDDSREQFDTTEDEISSRLRPYPGEEVHTMEETLEQSPNRFTPLRHDKEEDAEVEGYSTRGSSSRTSPGRFTSSHTSPLRVSSSRTSPGRVVSPPPVSHRYHVSDQSPEHRHKSRYHSPPPMSAPTPPHSRPDSTSPTRRSTRSVSPDPARRSPIQRSPPARRSHAQESQSERAVERAPAGGASRHAWSETVEGSRQVDEALRGRTAELPRDISEHERLYARESLDSESSNKDVNALWEKFQRRYTDSSSDGEGGSVKDVDLNKLSSLIKNPVQHVTQDVAAAGGSRSHSSSGGRTQKQRESRAAADQHHHGYYQDDRQYEDGHRRSGPNSRSTSHRAPRSHPVSEQPSLSHTQSVAFHTNTAAATPASDLTAKSTGTSRRDEATLQSIPEDTTLDSISTDITSSESNGSVSLIQRLPDDPKLLKLQTKIQRQRQKYEMEKVREQRRRQKINKLESLLAAKQSVESVSQYQGGHGEAAHHHGFTRPVYESDYTQHTTGHFTSEHSSPTVRPMSTSSGKSTSTPASMKGTSGEDMSFAMSEITSRYGGMHRTGRSDESSDNTLVDEASSKGTTTGYTTTQDETTPQQSEAENGKICKCCLKKKGKSKSKTHQRTSETRSKSDSKVRTRSKSPQKVTSRSKSPTKISRSQSPLKHKSARSPSPTGKRRSERSHSPTSKKSRHRDGYGPEDEQQYWRMEKPLKEHHNRNASYLEFEKPTHSHTERHNGKNTRRKETLRDNGTQQRSESDCQKSQQRQRRTDDRGSKENRDRQKENRSQKHTTSRTHHKDEKPDTFNIDDEESIDGTPAVRTIGINVPTPISLSPPTRRKVRDVTMISEAVQTTPHITNGDSSSHQRHVSPGRRHKHDAFTPEVSPDSSSTENVQPSRREQPKAAATQAGLAWYIPLKDTRPWRLPLRERQAHAVSMETWPPREEAWRAGYDLGSSWDRAKDTVTSDAEIYLTRANELRKQQEEGALQPKLSLQEAFQRRKQEFISESRERQKHLALKSEERNIQDMHSRHRAALFKIDRKLDPNKNAHPYSENLYQPKKRNITKKEMKELTNKKYANLEEVVKREEESKRTEEYRTNRLRAQNYKHKILSKVLHKKAAWVE